MQVHTWFNTALVENLTAEELVHYAALQPELTPLENALVNRLEHLLYETGWDCDGISGDETTTETDEGFWPTILRDPGGEELVHGWNT
jgi:hypothetical protein